MFQTTTWAGIPLSSVTVFKIPAVLRQALNQGYETEANNEKDIESVKTNAQARPSSTCLRSQRTSSVYCRPSPHVRTTSGPVRA